MGVRNTASGVFGRAQQLADRIVSSDTRSQFYSNVATFANNQPILAVSQRQLKLLLVILTQFRPSSPSKSSFPRRPSCFSYHLLSELYSSLSSPQSSSLFSGSVSRFYSLCQLSSLRVAWELQSLSGL